MELSAKVKKSINTGSRILIALLSLWFIYNQVFISENLVFFTESISQKGADYKFYGLIGLVVILMPLNWGVEAFKWQQLIRLVERVTMKQALQSVFTGITMSLFTPNRVGEFFGRLLTLKHADPMKGALLTITGSISQLLTTLLIGSVSCMIFIPLYLDLNQTWFYFAYYGVSFLLVGINTMLILMYFKVNAISRLTRKLIKPSWEKARVYMRIMRRLKRQLLVKVLLLSICRYMIFSSQFYILLIAFGLSIPWFNAFILISMTYFSMTAIPTMALVDMGIRGSVAIYFISMYFTNQLGVAVSIMAATTAIWLINLALPALIGVFFLHRLNLIRKTK